MNVFVPPYADARELRLVRLRLGEIYGYAYRALKRRISVIGLECPPPRT